MMKRRFRMLQTRLKYKVEFYCFGNREEREEGEVLETRNLAIANQGL
jgi:hypothetical protein